jgi:hypothetical protein
MNIWEAIRKREDEEMSALLKKMKSWSPLSAIRRWIQGNTDTLDELQRCAEGEIERIARDNGLSVSEFRTLASLGPNAADLLERRMAALDLDPVEVSQIAPHTFRDLQKLCSFCKSHGRCLRDLARNPANEAWKEYCPNAGTLIALDALPWSNRREW